MGIETLAESLQNTEPEARLWPPHEVAQALVDRPWDSWDIYRRTKAGLEERNQCAKHDEQDPESLTALNAHSKVARTLGRVVLSANRVLLGPYFAAKALKNEISESLYGPEADLDPPVECYQILGKMNPHPSPLARFMVEHAEVVLRAAVVCEGELCAPGQPYTSFAEVVEAMTLERRRAENAKWSKKKEAGHPMVGRKTGLQPSIEERPLSFIRDGVIENAYLLLQPLFAADLACAERGIYDKDEVLRIVLENAALFKQLVKTTSDSLPYCTPGQDYRTVETSIYAGTFYRMADVCTHEGAMRLQDDGRLVMPYADITYTGVCPLADTDRIASPPEFLPAIEKYYQALSERRDIPSGLLCDDKNIGSHLNLFFVHSAILARDLFFGTSHELVPMVADPTFKYSMEYYNQWFLKSGKGVAGL